MGKLYEILLVEPDIKLANSITNWLKKSQVTHLSDLELAKEVVNKNHWHLIIIDVSLDNKTSLDIIQTAKNIDFNTSVLVIGENIKIEFIRKAIQCHIDDLIFKPLNKNEFINKSYELCEEAKYKKGGRNILAIGAHPDDVEFGCGGTLAKFRAEGNTINIATLSLGALGGEPKTRKKEARLAANYLDANLFLGNFDDTKITNSNDAIKFIEDIINQTQPTHVYTHSFHDSHQDHRNIYKATITACRKIPNIFSYQSPSSTTEFRPNLFININDYLEEKIRILNCFESQINLRPYLQPEIVRASARYWGRFYNYQLVEPMEVIKGWL